MARAADAAVRRLLAGRASAKAWIDARGDVPTEIDQEIARAAGAGLTAEVH